MWLRMSCVFVTENVRNPHQETLKSECRGILVDFMDISLAKQKWNTGHVILCCIMNVVGASVLPSNCEMK